MREREDYPAVGGPESAGAVGEVHPDEHANDGTQDEAAEPADQALFVAGFHQESGTDDQVDLVFQQVFDEPSDLGRAMLAVPVHLDGNVVAVQGGVAVTGLHGPADAEVERQAYDRDSGRHLAHRVVG